MVADIKAQAHYFSKNVVIVMTGDLVNKGSYTRLIADAIGTFFKDLKEALSEKVIDLFFVPGNHDKVRSDFDQHMFSLMEGEAVPMSDDYEELLDKEKNSFKDYKKLITKIYNIFGAAQNHVLTSANTYGVDVLTFPPESQKYYFVSLNTALSSIGEEDYRRLRLGKKQIDHIDKRFREIGLPSQNDKTIVLAHHPVNWLVGKENDDLQNKLLSPTQWNANLYLCGHVHQRDAISWRNPHHSLTTLMTGFGWPDSGGAHAEVHMYSIYVLNLDINSMDIYVRSTNDSGKFVPDFRFYGRENAVGNDKIVYPIDNENTKPYIELYRAQDRSAKALFINSSFIQKQRKFYIYLCMFQNRIAISGEEPRKDYYYYKENKKMPSKYEEFCQPENFTKFLFMSLLQRICQTLVCELVRAFSNDQSLSNEIRCHIRYYRCKKLTDNNLDEKYIAFCKSYGNPPLLESDKERFRSPREIQWEGSLIKAAFIAQKPLLFEANREDSVAPYSPWTNFITFIPKFAGNTRHGLIDAPTRPYLSMGISCTDKVDNDYLRLFGFVNIDEIIGAAMDNYLHILDLEVADFISYAHSLTNNCGEDNLE